MPLTVKKVERTTKPGRYSDGAGLYLQITKSGAKSWVLRYERAGKETMLGLGPVHAFSLDEARARAREARQKLAEGIDPLGAKRATQAERKITFEEAAKTFFNKKANEWSNPKHRAQFLSTLKQYAFPVIGAKPVDGIDRADVLRVLEPIWDTKTETASRVRQRIEKVLGWATASGYRTGDNPARYAGNLEFDLKRPPKVARKFPALPYKELPSFLEELRSRDAIAARALEFTILTATRTSEVTGARWSEIDLEDGVWEIPAERMKADKGHRVPLSGRALEILCALPHEDGNAHVFIGGRKGAGMSNMAMANVLKRMDRADITVHGFRSTFRDWVADCTNHPNHIAEMALAHVVKGVEAHYRRGELLDKRKRLMEEWARYCAGETGADVTPIREVVSETA